MARPRKRKPFPPWKTAAPGGYEKAFVQVGLSQLQHETVLSLNPAAFRLYIYMLMECGGEKQFRFSRSQYEKFISRGGFQKACNELVETGLIEVIADYHHVRKPTVYAMSENWLKEKESPG